MKIGLFFGSFNPVHIGHLIIANHFVQCTDLKQIWFVISPHNPLKKKETLLNEYDRKHLVELAIDDSDYLKTSTIEFNLPQPSYTIDTLVYLKEKYPQHEFVLIMGSDNIEQLPKWKNYEVLLRDYFIYCYKRGAENSDLQNHPHIKIFDFPQLEISSTYIRQCIKNNIAIDYMVPPKAAKYIQEMNLYR